MIMQNGWLQCNAKFLFDFFFFRVTVLLQTYNQPYFSKNKNKIALAVLNGKNKKISVCCRQVPGRRYLCRYSSGRGVARVCQLTAAAPPSVTLATATCSLWSRLHVRLTIEDGPPHTLRKYNGFRFHAFVKLHKKIHGKSVLGNKIPLVVRPAWQSGCWLSGRHVTCPAQASVSALP